MRSRRITEPGTSSNRKVAFLRAINVGGHVVKMDQLRKLFASAGFDNVETFIASGNVIFEAKGSDSALEKKIEVALEKSLGYAVAVFVRSFDEIAALATREVFSSNETDEGTLYIAFLKSGATPATMARLSAVGSPVDEFRASGREIHWLCRGERLSDSKFMGPLFERTIGAQTTIRNMNTVRKLAAKYGR